MQVDNVYFDGPLLYIVPTLSAEFIDVWSAPEDDVGFGYRDGCRPTSLEWN